MAETPPGLGDGVGFASKENMALMQGFLVLTNHAKAVEAIKLSSNSTGIITTTGTTSVLMSDRNLLRISLTRWPQR